MATTNEADTAPAVAYEPVLVETSSTTPRLTMEIGRRATRPLSEKARAPGRDSTRR